MQTHGFLQNEQLQQRAAGDYGANEGHEGLLRHHLQNRSRLLILS